MIRWAIAVLWRVACRAQAWQDSRDTKLWLADVWERFPPGSVVRIKRTSPGSLWMVHSFDNLNRVVRLYGAEHGPRLSFVYWTDIPLSVRAVAVPARVLEPQGGPEAT